MYPFGNYYKRGGYEVSLERAITPEELSELGETTEVYIAHKGDIYGEESAVRFPAVQVATKTSNAIPLERKLRERGIEAISTSPGRVEIRVEEDYIKPDRIDEKMARAIEEARKHNAALPKKWKSPNSRDER